MSEPSIAFSAPLKEAFCPMCMKSIGLVDEVILPLCFVVHWDCISPALLTESQKQILKKFCQQQHPSYWLCLGDVTDYT